MVLEKKRFLEIRGFHWTATDDILLFVSEPARSVLCHLKIINTFSKFLGYKVNWSKSEALPLTVYCPSTVFS